jgi:hypothetical protein
MALGGAVDKSRRRLLSRCADDASLPRTAHTVSQGEGREGLVDGGGGGKGGSTAVPGWNGAPM